MTETLDLLDRLIGFPTQSAQSNLPLIDFVQDYLAGRGFAVHRIRDETGTKAGLFARIGPSETRGVMLSGHSDVVPVSGQNWTGDPFVMRRTGDKVYGRGATDMKGFLAAALALAHRIRHDDLREALKISISWDEEVGCRGIPVMLPHLEQTIGTPRLCIVGEPTSMQVGIGHKGKAAFRASFRGNAGHSAMAPNHVNALHPATDFVLGLRRIQADLAASGARDDAFEIPYSTVHVGRMNGGTALNIVPDQATVDFEYRNVDGDAPRDLERRIDDLAQKVGQDLNLSDREISLEPTSSYPGLNVASDAAQVAEVAGYAGGTGTRKVGYGTEAGHFAEAGIPVVICGPGSMAQGHIADEFVELSQLDACDQFMERLRGRLRANSG